MWDGLNSIENQSNNNYKYDIEYENIEIYFARYGCAMLERLLR